MTNKWRIKKYHALRSKSSKSVPELGRTVDPAISTVTFDRPNKASSSSIIPGPGIVARTQELTSRPIHCPRCGWQTRLIPSNIPRTMENIDKILLECSICGMWYKSSKWCNMEAEACMRKWHEKQQYTCARRADLI